METRKKDELGIFKGRNKQERWTTEPKDLLLMWLSSIIHCRLLEWTLEWNRGWNKVDRSLPLLLPFLAAVIPSNSHSANSANLNKLCVMFTVEFNKSLGCDWSVNNTIILSSFVGSLDSLCSLRVSLIMSFYNSNNAHWYLHYSSK